MPVTITLEAHVRPALELHVADGAHAASPFAGSAAVRAQLVAGDSKRVVSFDVLDGIVAGVCVEHVHGIHAVLAQAAAVGALCDVHVDPVGLVHHAAVGDHLHVAHAGGHAVWADWPQRSHQGVGDDVARAEAGDGGAGEGGVGQRTALGHDPDRPH